MPLALAPGWEAAQPYAIGLLFLGLATFVAIGALSHEEDRAWSATIIYLALGIVAAVGLNLLDIAPLDPFTDYALIERVTELALIVAIFAAGLAVERQINTRKWRSLAMLLLVVMPATIALIALFATQAMGLSLGAAIILGAVWTVVSERRPEATSDTTDSPPRDAAVEDDAATPAHALADDGAAPRDRTAVGAVAAAEPEPARR